MSIFKQPKLPWILAIAMLVINIVLIGFIWFAGPPKHPRGGPDIERTVALFKADLDLDAAQTAQVRQMFTAHFDEMKLMHDSLQAMIKNSLLGIGKAKPLDSSVKLDFGPIGELSRQLHAAKYQHFSDIRELCNADQKEKFDAMLPKLIHRQGKRPGHKGPPPPPRP
mgnify:CR=1 FL=1